MAYTPINSHIKIKFTDILALDDFIWFASNHDPSNLIETVYDERDAKGQMAILNDADPLFTQFDAYSDDFNSDYNRTGLYTVTYDGLNLYIESTLVNTVFSDLNTLGAITASIVNITTVEPIEYLSHTFSPATNIATYVKVNVTTSKLATSVSSPVVINPNTLNPFVFEWARGAVPITITGEDTDANEFSKTNVLIPAILDVANMSVGVINTPDGAEATISVTSTQLLQLTYSKDGITYQSSNKFLELAAGDYTAYIKDQFGAIIFKAFTVEVFVFSDPLTPLFVLPKSNSIRYAVRDTELLNINNTLSSEEDVRFTYQYRQMFLDTDKVLTQFKTSYNTLSAKLINTDTLVEVALSIVKKTNFIGTKDMRDAIVKKRTDEVTLGISFQSGDTYNYDTGVANGEYELSGSLPAWAKKDATFYIDTIGWLIIKSLARDETNTYWEIVVDYTPAWIDATMKVKTIFDTHPYEVYEYETDFATYLNKDMQLKLQATNTGWVDVNYISEVIQVREKYENIVTLGYYSDENTNNMYYTSGIKNKMILDGILGGYSPDGEQEVHLGDTRAVLVNSSMNSNFKLSIFDVPTAIARQISIAFSHKFMSVNGVFYIATDKADVETIGINTNLYNISINLVDANDITA